MEEDWARHWGAGCQSGLPSLSSPASPTPPPRGVSEREWVFYGRGLKEIESNRLVHRFSTCGSLSLWGSNDPFTGVA